VIATFMRIPKLRLGILKLEAPASRWHLWRGRERTELVAKQSFLVLSFPSGAWETAILGGAPLTA
jgi:hypothetical protein